MPFVWLVSAVGNSGMGQTTYWATQANGKTLPSFTMSQEDMLKQIGATSATTIPGSPTILSEDLRMPKTWKASLAFDAKLPGDIDFTVEGIYNWDLNPVVVSNANVYFGLNLNASYTLQKAKSYTEGIGDQVTSAYNNYRNSIHAVNDNETGYATYVAPNRFLLSATYKLKESKNVTNTFGLVYDAYQYGYLGSYSYSRYSYIFNSNVNNDPSAPGNLIYVPASRQELNNWDFKDNGKVNGEVYTADMQRDDFWTFIEQDDYLKTRKGQYSERGGAKMPWHHQLDFKYLRDMSVKWGKTKHTLQLGLDIENLLNFLCKDWGLYKQITGNTLLTYDAKNKQYTYNLVDGQRHTSTTQNYLSTASTYRIQFTIRYLFN